MKNSTANVGTRIKEIRLQKGITQTELSGDEITRNHLSLIESGKTLPSLKNICYIADRLGISAGYLLSDDKNEDTHFVSYRIADKAKHMYDKKDLDGCISVCRSIPEELRSDEISMLHAKALLSKVFELANASDMKAAYETIEEAARVAEKCGYLEEDFSAACKYYTVLLGLKNNIVIPDLLCDLHEISSYVTADIVMYMIFLSGIKIKADFFVNNCHSRHAKAVSLIEDGNFRDAFNILDKLSEDTSLPFYMRYFVYDDLEKCASDLGEFKAAYSAAKKKLEFAQ